MMLKDCQIAQLFGISDFELVKVREDLILKKEIEFEKLEIEFTNKFKEYLINSVFSDVQICQIFVNTLFDTFDLDLGTSENDLKKLSETFNPLSTPDFLIDWYRNLSLYGEELISDYGV